MLTNNTAIVFGMPDLQRDIRTWIVSIATSLCQPMDRVYRCLELTDIKVYRLPCPQVGLNIRRCSVDI